MLNKSSKHRASKTSSCSSCQFVYISPVAYKWPRKKNYHTEDEKKGTVLVSVGSSTELFSHAQEQWQAQRHLSSSSLFPGVG